MDRRTEEKKSGTLGMKFVLVLSILYCILGLVLYFIPQVQILQICYILSGFLIVAGIVLIVRYFLTESYLNMEQYSFSIGVLFVLLGMCALVRAQEVANAFPSFLGICILFTAIFQLQNSLDLKAISNRIWYLFLIVSVLMAVCAVLVILNPFKTAETLNTFMDFVLVIDGALSLLSMLYLSWQIRKYQKSEQASLTKEPLTENMSEDCLSADSQQMDDPTEHADLKSDSIADEKTDTTGEIDD